MEQLRLPTAQTAAALARVASYDPDPALAPAAPGSPQLDLPWLDPEADCACTLLGIVLAEPARPRDARDKAALFQRVIAHNKESYPNVDSILSIPGIVPILRMGLEGLPRVRRPLLEAIVYEEYAVALENKK